jgi:hypothetical protein
LGLKNGREPNLVDWLSMPDLTNVNGQFLLLLLVQLRADGIEQVFVTQKLSCGLYGHIDVKRLLSVKRSYRDRLLWTGELDREAITIKDEFFLPISRPELRPWRFYRLRAFKQAEGLKYTLCIR